jgi:hypothetical protein
MPVEIIITNDFEAWYDALTAEEQKSVTRVVEMLEAQGVALPFPHSSAIEGSKLALRELRVQHMGEPYRILYVFDAVRRAVLLVGGNKVGKGNRWYPAAIRKAEKLYAIYLVEIERE